jgi:hypothetical protein
MYIKTDSFTQTKHHLITSLHPLHSKIFTQLEGIAAKLLTYIQEVLGSILGWDVDYPD